MSGLRLTTFGEAQLVRAVEGEPSSVVLASSKPLALLVYLHCSPTKSARKEHLVDLLWADLSPDSARHALRQAVWYTRQRLGSDALKTTAANITLANALSSDWSEFWHSLEADQPAAAVSLYFGDFLAGFAMPGAVDFEDWVGVERHRLRRAFVGAVESVVREHLAAGENKQARDLARRARSIEPEQQTLHRLLLETLLAVGDRVSALAEAEALESGLRDHDKEPDPATKRLLAVVREEMQVGKRNDTSSERGVGALWAELVGREREFGEILDAWERAGSGPMERVHVEGAAGLGKTRLLDDLATRLRSVGATVVHVGAKVANRGVGYTLAGDLAAHVSRLPGAPGVSPDSATALVALNPTLSSRFPTKPDRATGEEALRRRSIAFAEMVSAVAEEKPLAMLLDDFHWADSASRDMILSACSSTDLKHILCVTAARPYLELEGTSSGLKRLILDPLSPSQIEAIVVSLGTMPSEAWSDELSKRLHECTGGSPLLVLETLHMALERDLLEITDDEWACPDSSALWAELAAGGALRNRISQLDRNQAEVLLLLAVAGTPLTRAQLEGVARNSIHDPFPQLDSLVQRGLVSKVGDNWLPSHDEIADISIELASADAQQAAHAVVGESFALLSPADGRDLTIAARHFALAGEAAELKRTFARLVDLTRNRGDERTVAQIASEVLPETERPETRAELVRSLPLAKRLPRSTMRLAATMVAVAIVAGLSLLAGVFRPSQQRSDATLLLMGETAPNGYTVLSLPLDLEHWDSQSPMELEGSSRTYASNIEIQALGSLAATHPAGGPWLSSYVFPDSGGAELVLFEVDGTMERLTFSPGDEEPFDWSPDGSEIVFQTARWNEMSFYDLAILDIATKQVRPLVRGDSVYDSPSWSPDGTRISYTVKRAATTMARTCWITVDGASRACMNRPDDEFTRPIGWRDPSTLAVRFSTRGGTALGLWNLVTDAVDTLDGLFTDLRDVKLSPNGAWVAIKQASSYPGEPELSVMPLGRPELRRLITGLEHEWPAMQIGWAKNPAVTTYLDSLDFDAPVAVVPLNAPHTLAVDGFDASGKPFALNSLTFGSSNTAVATIDVHGLLMPRHTGETTVTVSAGGWRRDTIRVSVVEPDPVAVFSEEWDEGYTMRWHPFGIPKPSLRSRNGIRAISTNGDGSYSSGVYSIDGFDAAEGLGIEIEASTPTTGVLKQNVAVILATLDSVELSVWDHATGFPPGRTTFERGPGNCGFWYPVQDRPDSAGLESAKLANTPFVVLDEAALLHTGRWYTITLQVFPDESCGLALDGVAVARSKGGVDLEHPLHVMLFGTALEDGVLLGPAEVWSGVRGDIDWRVLHVADSAREHLP